MSNILKTLCRTCMSARANISIDTSHNKGPTIIELLHSVQLPSPVHIQDKLPKIMCLGCVEQLQQTYEFLQMCKDTEQKFLKLLPDDEKVVPENPPIPATLQKDRNKALIENSGYDSQVTKYEIEIFENEPNYQQQEFEPMFVNDQLQSYDKEKFEIEERPTNNSKEEVPGSLYLSVKVNQSVSKKHDPAHTAKFKRTKNFCKSFRSRKTQKPSIQPEIVTPEPVYEENPTNTPKECGPTCSSPSCFKSKLRNCEKFNEEIRHNIFKHFWGLAWEAKRYFIRDHVILVAKKRKAVENSRKQNTFVFNLPYDNDSLQVCRTMFLSTLNISKNIFRGWMVEDKPIPPRRYGHKKHKSHTTSLSNNDIEVKEISHPNID